MFKFSKEKLCNIMQGNIDFLVNSYIEDNIANQWLASIALLQFIEYALKYKIQSYGKEFKSKHTIGELYKCLSDEDKTTIENDFKNIKLGANDNSSNSSHSVGNLLDTYNTEYTYIRYGVLEDNQVHGHFKMREMLVAYITIIKSTDIEICHPIIEKIYSLKNIR